MMQDDEKLGLYEETLEEAIERTKEEYPVWLDEEAFRLGAKWQQERMYSEEDMVNFAYHYMNERKDFGARALTPELLIKQFKKK